MAQVYAEWEVLRRPAFICSIRKDTRIYPVPKDPPGRYDQKQGQCIGTIWMCNPGTKNKCGTPPIKTDPITESVDWGIWSTLDQTMKNVVAIVDQAQQCVKAGPGAKKGDYIQVLNLFYVCGSTWEEAWALQQIIARPWYRESPRPKSRFIWLAWGKGNRPDELFCGNSSAPQFYYGANQVNPVVLGTLPLSQFPMHPQYVNRGANYDTRIAKEMSHYLMLAGESAL